MKFTFVWLLLACCALFARAGELKADLFASTPDPSPMEVLAPRALAVNAVGTRCYLLDAGLRRLLIATPEGQFIGTKSIPAGELAPVKGSADGLLPNPALAAAKDGAYLLRLEAETRRLTVTSLDGPESKRILTVPEGAAGGAVTLEPGGRVLAAYLATVGGKTNLVLAREGDDGNFATIGELKDPAEGQADDLVMSGITVAPDGRIALGIAQRGDAVNSFVRSWLIAGKLQGAILAQALTTADRMSLLDSHGKLQDRYRLLGKMAGQAGYPLKPCVPLYTSLAVGPDDLLLTGGNALDPFLRVYRQHRLQCTIPRKVAGCQSVVIFDGKQGPRLFDLNPDSGCVDELTLDGRVVNGFGRPIAYQLHAPKAMAADAQGLYVAAEWNETLHLVRFNTDGQFLWARNIAPPPTLAGAQVFLAVPAQGRVIIGWRKPDAAGLGFVETMLDDGMPGVPFWADPVTGSTSCTEACATPMIAGDNGKAYLLRETVNGLKVQMFSMTGAYVLSYPASVLGVTAADANGFLAWAHHDANNMVISRFKPEGDVFSVKRVPRKADKAALRIVSASGWWGWLSGSNNLLHFDDTMNMVEENTVQAPDGNPLGPIAALAGDGKHNLYLAQADRVLVIKDPGK